jgi:hypothetical protein
VRHKVEEQGGEQQDLREPHASDSSFNESSKMDSQPYIHPRVFSNPATLTTFACLLLISFTGSVWLALDDDIRTNDWLHLEAAPPSSKATTQVAST